VYSRPIDRRLLAQQDNRKAGALSRSMTRCALMTFPETRRSVIQEIAATGDQAAWHRFVADYWGPLCRFAMRGGRLSLDDAEDVTLECFLALLKNRLLARWIDQPTARLRTLLCSVVRNIMANRGRVEQGRAELLGENRRELEGRRWLQVGLEEPAAEQADAFYAAWTEELLQSAVEALLSEYHEKGQGDHFRVLYGRLCEGLTAREVADALGLSLSQSENAYKHAVRRLRAGLEDLVRRHVEGYCAGGDPGGELPSEWARLEAYLHQHGGLEQAVRQAYQGLDPRYDAGSKVISLRSALSRLDQYAAGPTDGGPG
jgi:RNA polymerase sigma factor (sigma-70 family)